jgi:hypothetical protein
MHIQELNPQRLPLRLALRACAARLSSRVEREAQAASWCGVTAVKRMRGAPLLGFILHLYLNVLVVTQAHPRPPHLAQIPQPIRSQRTLVLTLQCACNETSSSMRMKDRGVSALY